ELYGLAHAVEHDEVVAGAVHFYEVPGGHEGYYRGLGGVCPVVFGHFGLFWVFVGPVQACVRGSAPIAAPSFGGCPCHSLMTGSDANSPEIVPRTISDSDSASSYAPVLRLWRRLAQTPLYPGH